MLSVAIDDDGLTPILDAKRRPGWPRGWRREFEYVEYRGDHWIVGAVLDFATIQPTTSRGRTFNPFRVVPT